MVGRFAIGGAADRIGRRFATALMLIGMSAMLFLWLAATGRIALVAFALVFGVCYGGFVALVPALTADYFGGRSVSGILGFLYTSVALGTLFGPTLAGLAFDLFGSYALPITAGAVANLIAIGCVALTVEPARFRARLANA